MMQEQAIQTLRDILARVSHESSDESFRVAAEIRDAKESVLKKYQPIFAPANLDYLTPDDFRSFLLFRNNKHWDGIHRQGGRMTSDMPKLREALKILLNENLDIETRLNRLRPLNDEPMVKGLARSVITAVLQVVYPDKYGVWNTIAENAMKQLGLFPEMPRNAGFGNRYSIFNHVLLETAAQLRVDLWTLDMLWWRVDSHMPHGRKVDAAIEVSKADEERIGAIPRGIFGLEKYLHEFLVDNWENISRVKDWELLEEDGEVVGSYFNTKEIGEIDLLAKRRDGSSWLVVELKKDQTSDSTIGQVLRYMGWVRQKLANGSDVRGLIVCRDIDKRLQYALDEQPNIECLTYEVSFTLNDLPRLA